MPFRWEEHAAVAADGLVLAVDVSRHARQVGLQVPTFVSRGFWMGLVGARTDREEETRLVDMLRAARRTMETPARVNEDGSAMLFGLRHDAGGPLMDVVSVMNEERTTMTFMLWREFEHRPTGPRLRVRVVAEDEVKARA